MQYADLETSCTGIELNLKIVRTATQNVNEQRQKVLLLDTPLIVSVDMNNRLTNLPLNRNMILFKKKYTVQDKLFYLHRIKIHLFKIATRLKIFSCFTPDSSCHQLFHYKDVAIIRDENTRVLIQNDLMLWLI